MLESLRARWTVTLIATVLGVLYIAPNFVKLDKDNFLAKSKMTLGLDIQGGLHIVMGVDVKNYVKEQISITARELELRFKDDGINVQNVAVTGENADRFEINATSEKDKDAALKYLKDYRGSELQVLSSNGNKIELQFFEPVIIEKQKQVIQQAIDVIRNRIDQFGVNEPSITAQGSDRILVQLPGIKDAEGAKELINRTAKLDFMIVDSEFPPDKLEGMIASAEKAGKYKLGKEEGGLKPSEYFKRINDDLAKDLPKDTKVVFEKLENVASLEVGRRPYLVKTDSKLNGGELETANVRPDEFGKPQVNFRFKPSGRKLFADLTGKAAGGFIAIVLDDIVQSAPRVERMIDSESAVITLGATRDYQASLKEATFIATALRAGALPAALEQMEERTVGPSLGSDSIAKGQKAAGIGVGLVFLFMILYYRGAGFVADLTLILNLIFTFAILSSLGATLTLPGVAGIALTVGMAVDANVIIYERIKEEMARGATGLAAIKDGFSNAFASIFDSNLTTVLTCLILMYYGTGPIRGFAVSLSVGITVSMFTAIFVTRLVLETFARNNINMFSVKRVQS